ncbi:CHAT domain-containing protein [Pseudonocardia sp.]|uniref:CHAT domain-containing protein n=1 Tax=Pseudonocardia sp. TaxID=60912 RepID=UPI003D0AB628
MHRIVVRVDAAGAAGGWRVTVRSGSAEGEVLSVYPMASTDLGRRRVPATPPERAPEPGEPHTALCTGDRDELSGLLGRIARGRTRQEDVATYGRWLFECLLAPAWPVVLAHPEVVRAHAVELALRWPAADGDLHRLVWEAMRDGIGPLAGHPSAVIAVTRLVPAPPTPVRTVTRVPSVLFATSVALTDPTIRPGAMYMGLLREFDLAGRCRARAIAKASAEDLHAAFDRWRPDLVHLVAHGVRRADGEPVVLLADGAGAEQEIDAAGLLAALGAGGERPLAVALSVCHTASSAEAGDGPADAAPLAARLVAGGIPIVSAMAGEVRESACRLYTRRLAAALHDGQPVVTASAHGRRAALLGTEQPSADIDWALPALYLGEHVEPAQRLVHAETATALTRLSDTLGLRREPVFIGREEVLAAADTAVEPSSPVGVITVMAKGPTSGMGGTRLLQEIGWRVLRDGHVPLLLGPYQDPRTMPTTSWGLVHALLWRVVLVAELMELPPFVPLTLRFELGDEGAALAAAMEQDVPALARATLRQALRSLLDRPGDVDPILTRDLLAEDLDELARRAATVWGAPFGPHTRAVVLCDDVHEWSRPPPDDGRGPLTALGCLLSMLNAHGLGRPERPAPVVLTASTTLGDGGTVALWSATGRPGFLVHPMDDLTPEERVVGYQWVLLHPWTTKPAEERQVFGAVYTSLPGRAAHWEATLQMVGGRPTSVADRLYFAVQVAVANESGRRNDDEHAWNRYVEAHPEYRL